MQIQEKKKSKKVHFMIIFTAKKISVFISGNELSMNISFFCDTKLNHVTCFGEKFFFNFSKFTKFLGQKHLIFLKFP